MRYISTNRSAHAPSFEEALLKGQAPDQGLYVPESLPRLEPAQLEAWSGLSYAELAAEFLGLFLSEEVEADALRSICRDAYTYEVPLEAVVEGQYVMRLDRGPTASFKDFAARAMARLMSYFLGEQQRDLLILTATSGDTGSAIAHAFYQVPGIQVAILFPKDEVSPRQRKQMTTLGKNIAVLAVDGKFDDCQAMVKQAFSDPQLSALPLTSANSINIGRLLPQAVYYVYAHTRLARADQPMLFSIPCGNFGNMMGAMYAWKMGLPLRRLVLAVNENDEAPQFLETGHYQKIEPSRNCLSNAMNVGHPSNFARLVHLYGGRMDQKGTLHEAPDLEQMRRELFSISVSDAQTRQTIAEAYQKHGLLLEPHGAVAWFGLQRYLEAHGQGGGPCVAIETAHPAKFPEAVEELLGFQPEVPPSLAAIEEKSEAYEMIENDYRDFVSFLEQNYGE